MRKKRPEQKLVPSLLTVKQVAKALGVEILQVYLHINNNKIRAFKEGREWRVKAEDLNKYIEGKLNEKKVDSQQENQ